MRLIQYRTLEKYVTIARKISIQRHISKYFKFPLPFNFILSVLYNFETRYYPNEHRPPWFPSHSQKPL